MGEDVRLVVSCPQHIGRAVELPSSRDLNESVFAVREPLASPLPNSRAQLRVTLHLRELVQVVLKINGTKEEY